MKNLFAFSLCLSLFSASAFAGEISVTEKASKDVSSSVRYAHFAHIDDSLDIQCTFGNGIPTQCMYQTYDSRTPPDPVTGTSKIIWAAFKEKATKDLIKLARKNKAIEQEYFPGRFIIKFKNVLLSGDLKKVTFTFNAKD
jgi:hypothetical protein